MRALSEKYGGSSRTALNRAIRAEYSFGGQLLDGIDLLRKIQTRQTGEASRIAGLGADILAGIRDRLCDELIAKYAEQSAAESARHLAAGD